VPQSSECISADGTYLNPLIVWPASTHRSTWTIHPTPGWHFACSKTGYTDTEISLSWIQHVFDPLTRQRANHKPRILINDGFGTHESLELMRYCFENNIILCRLPSHTSHKLQPCDVGVFGPLKTGYRVLQI
jgi:DDE superfamily endonuclease